MTGVAAPDATGRTSDLQAQVAKLLAPLGFVEVTEPVRLGGGSSQENWAFTARATDPASGATTHELLLRRDPASGVIDTSRAQEFALLRALGATDLPVARVHALDDGTLCGRPAMVVDRLAGRADRALLRDKDPLGLGAVRREELARELPALLGRVHRVDVRAVGLADVLGPAPRDPARSELDRWIGELDDAALEPLPALRVVADWLAEHVPAPPAELRLVHGDFRPANVLVDGGDISALLDWELARLGDPHDDLGWYTCSVYRAEHFLPGRFEPAHALEVWSETSGMDIDPERLHFWQVMSTFRLAVIAVRAVRNFCEGTTDRPAAPPTRVVRLALAETGLVPPEQAVTPPLRPGPAEVVAGVRAVLRDTIAPELTSGHAQARLAEVRAVLAQVDWDEGVLALRDRTNELRAALALGRRVLGLPEEANDDPAPATYAALRVESERLARLAPSVVRDLRATWAADPANLAVREALTQVLAAL